MCSYTTLWFITYRYIRFRLLLFSDINVSQGVATFVRCGGIFNDSFITHLLLSPLVKNLLKSVSIWRTYGQKYSGAIFSAHGVHKVCMLAEGMRRQRRTEGGRVGGRVHSAISPKVGYTVRYLWSLAGLSTLVDCMIILFWLDLWNSLHAWSACPCSLIDTVLSYCLCTTDSSWLCMYTVSHN